LNYFYGKSIFNKTAFSIISGYFLVFHYNISHILSCNIPIITIIVIISTINFTEIHFVDLFIHPYLRT